MRKVVIFTILIIIFMGIILYGSYYLNNWRGEFWQSISDKNISKFWIQIVSFTVAAFILVYASAAQTWIQSKLSLALREHYSADILSHYLCHTVNTKDYLNDINPDQRIAEDFRLITTNGVNLVCGLVFSIAKSVVFIWLLYSFSVQFFSNGAILPLGAIGYCLLGALMAFLIGKKLVSLSYANQTAEARYRTGLIDIRTDVGNDHKHNHRFQDIIINSLALFNRQKLLNLWIGTYSQSAVIVPILIIAPVYFGSTALTFGILMQIINAVAETIESLSYLTSNWQQLTELKACFNRINHFKKNLANNPN